MGLGFSPMVLCVVQRLCASTFFRSYRTLHLLISKAEISHEHCERTVVFLEPLSFCQQREVTKSLQLKSRCVKMPQWNQHRYCIGEINHVNTFLTNHKRTQRITAKRRVLEPPEAFKPSSHSDKSRSQFETKKN